MKNRSDSMALYIRILLFTAVTVAPSCALQMTFSQKGGLFYYNISDRPAGADCRYSYYNATNHPIAYIEEEASLVLNSSLDGLVTSECIEHLFFEVTCDKGEHNSTNVKVACEDLRNNEDAADMHNSSSMPPPVTNGSSKDQTVLVVLVVLAVLVVLVVLAVLVVLVVVLVMRCKCEKKYEVCRGKIFERFCGPGQEPGPAGTPMLEPTAAV